MEQNTQYRCDSLKALQEKWELLLKELPFRVHEPEPTADCLSFDVAFTEDAVNDLIKTAVFIF